MNRIDGDFVEVKVDGVLRQREYTLDEDDKGMMRIIPDYDEGQEKLIQHVDGTVEIITVVREMG